MKYDPARPLDPAAWAQLADDEKASAVEEYHRRRRIKMPNRRVHAAFHVAVENQVAMGEAFPADATLKRLMSEGLDRHEAIHAIGSVLAAEVFQALKEKRPCDNEEFARKVAKLTARSWREQFGS